MLDAKLARKEKLTFVALHELFFAFPCALASLPLGVTQLILKLLNPMTKYIVATVDEIPPGERKVLEVAGRTIGVFNIQGEFFALRNQCPHQGGPLCSGRLTGFLTATKPGDYTYTRRGEMLRCPWHGWEFDVKTGQSWFDPAHMRVRAYQVSVETVAPVEEEVGLEKGPYVAESYPVTVEQSYVLVEI